MAIIKVMGIAGELSGKMGGSVFSRNRAGAYVKANAIPINPNTGAQQQARLAFANSSAGFHSLTGAQKTAWQEFANNDLVTKGGKMPGSLSGQNAFVSLNAAAQFAETVSNQNDTFGLVTGTVEHFTPPSNPPAGMLLPGMKLDSGARVQLRVDNVVANTTGSNLSNLTLNVKVLGSTALGSYDASDMIGIDNKGNDVPVGFIASISKGMVQEGLFVSNPRNFSTQAQPALSSLSSALNLNSLQLSLDLANDASDYQAVPQSEEVVQVELFQISQNGMFRKVGTEIVEIP